MLTNTGYMFCNGAPRFSQIVLFFSPLKFSQILTFQTNNF